MFMKGFMYIYMYIYMYCKEDYLLPTHNLELRANTTCLCQPAVHMVRFLITSNEILLN